jgi:DNA-binding NarL/FixJ family response regulator
MSTNIGQKICVVLADDHPQVLGGIRRLLEGVAETILMVTDESSLCRAVEKFHPDVVIADLSLPVSTERNVARLLRERYPESRLIILSVHDEKAVMREMMAEQARGFVLKRRVVVDLIPAIHEILKGHVYVSQDLKEAS